MVDTPSAVSPKAPECLLRAWQRCCVFSPPTPLSIPRPPIGRCGEACRVSFDRLDSDGAMSTNDTVLLMASGAADVIPDAEAFTGAVTEACMNLSRQLLSDAEGATKEVAITVTGAADEADAVTRGSGRGAQQPREVRLVR